VRIRVKEVSVEKRQIDLVLLGGNRVTSSYPKDPLAHVFNCKRPQYPEILPETASTVSIPDSGSQPVSGSKLHFKFQGH
jgi:hypothetical protein